MSISNKTELLFAFLISCTTIQAQQISGKIIDSKNEPIPYASIQIGKSHGTISNEEGNFSIDLKNHKPTDSVAISCLGFEKLGLIIDQFSSKDYALKEQVNELSEVYLSNRSLSIDSILYYVKANLKKNYKTDQSEFKLFSRKTEYVEGKTANFEITKSTGFNKKQLELFNSDFDNLEKSLINNNSKQYTDFIGSLKILNDTKTKLDVEKAIRLLDEKNNQSLQTLGEKGNDIVLKHLDTTKVYTVKTGLFKISDSVSLNNREDKMADTINSLGHVKEVSFKTIKKHNFISNKEDLKLDFVTETKKYKYELKDVTFLNNEVVYIINFVPKRSSAKYEGTMYVSDESFAVLRADYSFYKNRVGERLNLKLLLGIKYIERNNSGTISYKKHEDGFYYPHYINESIDRYFFIERPFKFIDNDDRGQKVAFEFKIEGTFKEKTELLILSKSELSTIDFEAFKELKSIDYITPKSYDPTIWKDYDVLEPLNEMKNFKVEE